MNATQTTVTVTDPALPIARAVHGALGLFADQVAHAATDLARRTEAQPWPDLQNTMTPLRDASIAMLDTLQEAIDCAEGESHDLFTARGTLQLIAHAVARRSEWDSPAKAAKQAQQVIAATRVTQHSIGRFLRWSEDPAAQAAAQVLRDLTSPDADD